MTPRSESKDFAVTGNLYRILRSQADVVLQRVQALVGTLPTDLAAKLPLFPSWRKLKAAESIAHLTSQMLDDSLHRRVRALTSALQKILVISPRTGKRLHVNPRRFRYTLGSRAAREGFGEYVIAELLDHTDTQNAVIYTRQHPNFRLKIDEAVGQALIPLAQAYAGTLVDGGTPRRQRQRPDQARRHLRRQGGHMRQPRLLRRQPRCLLHVHPLPTLGIRSAPESPRQTASRAPASAGGSPATKRWRAPPIGAFSPSRK